MKRVFIYSPDFSLCYSLLVYLQNYYKIVVTTDIELVNNISFDQMNDAIFIDHEPNSQLLTICEKIKSKYPNVPIFLTYVYNKRISQAEEKIKSFVKEIFYKPFDLNEISLKITDALDLSVRYD
jgi:DNA-binding NtrC family response regulator